MKKKILALLTVLVMTASLCACGGPTPTEVVDQFMTAIQTQDAEAVSAAYAGEDFDFIEGIDMDETDEESETPAMDKVLEEKMFPKMMEFEYTLSNEVIDGETASVDVTIKTYNFGNAFSTFMTNYLTQAFTMAFSGASDESMDKTGANLLSTELDNLTEKNVEKTATVTLTATDDGWVIDEIDEDGPFYNALTGGLVDTIEALDEAYGE